MENGFFLCFPDEKSTKIIAECLIPLKKEHLHMSVLVLKNQIKEQLYQVEMKEPIHAKIQGVGSLTTRNGTLVTVLHLEALPCINFKLYIMKRFGIVVDSDVYGELQRFHITLF